MTAADFYEWVADCARERDMLAKRSDALRMPRTNGMAIVSSSSASDPTASRALAAVSGGPGIDEAIRRCDQVLRRAAEVTAAVGLACGPSYALALRLHYLEGNQWDAISCELHVSLSSLYRMRRTALGWVDSEGLVASLGKVGSC